MNCLVIGGGGFLGRHVVDQLLARGHQVSTLGRSSYPHLPAEVQQHRGCMQDPETCRSATTGQEVVFLVAGVARIDGGYEAYRRINVDGPATVIESCREQGVRRLVLTSTPSVVIGTESIVGGDETLPYQQRPLSHYQRSKTRGEQLVLDAHEPGRLETVVLRPHAIFGPGERNSWLSAMLERAAAGKLKIVGRGNNLISVSYVENAAHAHVLASTAPRAGGRAYFINEAEPVPLWSWFNQILARLGRSAVIRRVPYRLAYAAGATAEMVTALRRPARDPPLSRYLVALMGLDHTFSTAEAERDLEYQPVVEIERALEQTVAWFRQEGM